MRKRIDDLEKNVNILLNSIQGVNDSIVNGFNKIDNNFVFVHAKFDVLDENIRILSDRIENLNSVVSNIKGKSKVSLENIENSINELNKDTHIGFSDLKEEIQKINSVTSYDSMYKNMKAIEGGKKGD